MKNLATFILAVMMCTVGISGAQAAVVTYAFKAELNGQQIGGDLERFGELAGEYSEITGTISWDPSTPSYSDNGPNSIFYPTGLIAVDQISLSGEPVTDVWIVNDATSDWFSMWAQSEVDFDGAGSVGLDSIEVYLEDFTGSVFSSAALPDSLQLSDFAFAQVFFRSFTLKETLPNGNQVFSNVGDASFTITSLELVDEIPLPGALPLFLAGAAGIGFVRRRRAARA